MLSAALFTAALFTDSWLPFFNWCGETWLGTTVRDHELAFPIIETFHLLALAALLGSVLIVNLRAFGLGKRFASKSQVSRELEPWIRASIVVLILSGIPMFLSEPMKCYESYSFPIKMILLLIAILWHFTVQRKWLDSSAVKTKLAACISIGLWAGIGLAGKGIPYI